MKKIFLLLSLSTLFMYSCQDVNDDFDWLDGLTDPQNVKAYEYTIAEADYATIASAAKGTENEESAKLLQTAKIFSDVAPADKLVPYLLAKKYFTADVGSSAKITYQYQSERDAVVSALSTSEDNTPYILKNEDYKEIWDRTPFATALTPAKSPETVLPGLLKTKYTEAKSGDYKIIEYAYSEDEPITKIVQDMKVDEDFENNPSGAGTNIKVDIENWTNVDVSTAANIFWQSREYSGNKYAQITSYKSGALNDAWLISPQIDLTNSTTPYFSFDIVTGNYNATCLKIFISEDFDGNTANVLAATWTDITTNFTLPTPASGYSAWASAGTMPIGQYKDKKIHIAFRYEGDDLNTTKKTTTYQIDNVKIYDEVVGFEVESKETQYAAYTFDGSAWKAAASYIKVLQPNDYASMTLTNGILAKDKASHYLPIYAAKNFDYTLPGNDLVFVYQNEKGSFYADRVKCVEVGKWEVQNFIETKTEQFMLSTIGWVFDPTFVVTMVKGKGETDDYMLVVQEVIDTKLESTPTIVNSYKDTEYYYGFNANYGNITYRDKDRVYDPSYPASASEDEKRAFCEQRTLEGFAIYLRKKFPDAAAEVNGVEQKARITTTLYYGPASSDTEAFTYEFQCLGNNEWKYLQRTSLATGKVEKAEE
ncbi:choice-of-anchor J domain-containing protein [Dysgonomonas massiliensis]|uniref:choice-of-anchor J domain-containing protein n=1 Tax=Dysgonomonas massiliensis TaxID=2040292 RepID=UPI001359293D|nr:choice-of-anchor J domain-containing protein [Dysgonomonas massiliensis]